MGDPQPNSTSATTRQWKYRGLAVALVILFLMSVARFYHPGTGFTALIGFPQGHESEALEADAVNAAHGGNPLIGVAAVRVVVVDGRAGGVRAHPVGVRRRVVAVAVAYAALMLMLDSVLADPNTAAITRVLLPLTVGFNILLAKESRPVRFWSWFVAGNLHLLSALRVMPLVP